MKYRGDIEVKRTGIFDRRADQGLNDHTITTSLVLTRHAAYHQLLNATAGNDLVVLPDATELPEGWTVEIFNDGNVALRVQDDQNDASFDDIAISGGNRYKLLDNSTAEGIWFVEPMEAQGATVATRYTEDHDATTDWGSASAGYYTITILASTHGRGTTPKPQFFESDGGTGFDEVAPDKVNIASNGDISFRVPDDPDLRYAGRVIVM